MVLLYWTSFVTYCYICLVRPPCEAHKKRADGKGVNQNHQPYVVVGRKEESPTHLCKLISEERTNSDGYYINGYRIPYDGSSHFIDSACPPRMTGFITIRIIVLCINTFTMYGGANIRAFYWAGLRNCPSPSELETQRISLDSYPANFQKT